MNKFRATEYIVYDGKGNEVARGDKHQIGEIMNYSDDYITNCYRNKRKLHGVFTIKRKTDKPYVYQLVEDNGNIKYEGTASDLAKRFKLSLRSVYQCYYAHHKLHRKYTVQRRADA